MDVLIGVMFGAIAGLLSILMIIEVMNIRCYVI